MPTNPAETGSSAAPASVQPDPSEPPAGLAWTAAISFALAALACAAVFATLGYGLGQDPDALSTLQPRPLEWVVLGLALAVWWVLAHSARALRHEAVATVLLLAPLTLAALAVCAMLLMWPYRGVGWFVRSLVPFVYALTSVTLGTFVCAVALHTSDAVRRLRIERTAMAGAVAAVAVALSAFSAYDTARSSNPGLLYKEVTGEERAGTGPQPPTAAATGSSTDPKAVLARQALALAQSLTSDPPKPGAPGAPEDSNPFQLVSVESEGIAVVLNINFDDDAVTDVAMLRSVLTPATVDQMVCAQADLMEHMRAGVQVRFVFTTGRLAEPVIEHLVRQVPRC